MAWNREEGLAVEVIWNWGEVGTVRMICLQVWNAGLTVYIEKKPVHYKACMRHRRESARCRHERA